MGIYVVRAGGSRSANKHLSLQEDELFLELNVVAHSTWGKNSVFERMKEYASTKDIELIHVCSVQYWDGDNPSKSGLVLQFRDTKQKLLFKLIFSEEEFKML